MRVQSLPVVAQLGNGSVFAHRNEDRVEAEAFAAAWLVGDTSFEHARAPKLLAGGGDDDELAHVARVAVFDTGQLTDQPAHRIVPAGTRRLDSRPASERRHLDAGVLSQRPLVGLRPRPTEERLAPRVLVVRRSVLGRVAVRFERLDPPAGQQLLELARLVRVARGEPRRQSVHRTSATCSRSAIRATMRAAGVSRGNTTSNSRRLRSPSWLTSS